MERNYFYEQLQKSCEQGEEQAIKHLINKDVENYCRMCAEFPYIIARRQVALEFYGYLKCLRQCNRISMTVFEYCYENYIQPILTKGKIKK